MITKIVFNERFDSVLSDAVVSTYSDRNSNDIHGKTQCCDAHGDVIFIQIRFIYYH